jgi:hypothetical protein
MKYYLELYSRVKRQCNSITVLANEINEIYREKIHVYLYSLSTLIVKRMKERWQNVRFNEIIGTSAVIAYYKARPRSRNRAT